MPKKSPTKSKLVFNGVLIALGVALYAGLWYGTNYISGVIMREQSKSTESRSALSSSSDIERLLSEKVTEIKQVNSYVLSDDEVVGFIEELENLALRVGVDESTDSVSDVKYPGLDGERWGGLQVTLSVTGSWNKTYEFLSLLERLPYRADLLRAVVEKANDEWRGEFTIKVLRDKKVLP